MFDSYYTPKSLAEELINYIEKSKIKLIADFCVGDGELLRAAEKKWRNATFIANDISKEAIEYVKKHHQEWITHCQDFLSSSTPGNPLEEYKNKIDLILLNPPLCVKQVVTPMKPSWI